jgi:hypothetical protein
MVTYVGVRRASSVAAFQPGTTNIQESVVKMTADLAVAAGKEQLQP